MVKDDRGYVHRLLQIRHSTIELVALALVLAFGVNLASSGIADLLGVSQRLMTLIGLALIGVVLAYMAAGAGPTFSRTLRLSGVLPIDKSGEVVEISRYEFSEKMRSYVRAMESESKVLSALWRRARFRDHSSDSDESASKASERGDELVREGIEYFVLSRLSMHLTDYFVSERRADEGDVLRIQRHDIPHMLLENRFLELFSKPMHQRDAFVDSEQDEQESDDAHNVVFAIGEDGQIFDQFELILPKGSKLTRRGPCELEIRTRRFSLTLSSGFERSSTVFPDGFDEYYLGAPFDEIHPYVANLSVKIDFRWWAMLTSSGWDYFAWLDSFMDTIEDEFSFDRFVVSIGWPTALSAAIAVKHATSSRGAASQETPDN